MSFAAGVFCERKQYVTRGGKKNEKNMLADNAVQWTGLQSGLSTVKCSYKVLPPRDPTSGPQFRLGEICRAQGFNWPAGCAGNMASANVRLYLFLFHLSTGTCPLHP